MCASYGVTYATESFGWLISDRETAVPIGVVPFDRVLTVVTAFWNRVGSGWLKRRIPIIGLTSLDETEFNRWSKGIYSWQSKLHDR